MTYNFNSLSPADFEDLARDVVGCHLGFRFEAFGPGPDGGVDGRHSTANEITVLQAKHYRQSGFPSLAREMRRECASVDRLAPDRYVLATSVSLTPTRKARLAEILGPHAREQKDLFGFEDLNSLLRSHPEVAKSHVKLWLSETAVLERIIQAAAFNFTGVTAADISAKLRVYAENPSFPRAKSVLENHRVLIVSGPPGVGKTTLAEMLAYAYIGDGWELVALRSLEDGFLRLNDEKRQIFFFDDFLGRIALDERALSNSDSDFAKFISRVQRTPTSRFILTTRAYIYEHAKLLSDTLSSRRLDLSRFVLNVGVYTRRVRARILYNHFVVARVPVEYIRALDQANAFKCIIDHPNYNPRIIEWMTESSHFDTLDASSYSCEFIYALDDPGRIWDKAFRNHIHRRCQHLLYALFFASEHGAEIDNLRDSFDFIHPLLSRTFGLAWSVTDFDDALKSVEGSFVAIAGRTVSFINPSVRDYLDRHLTDKSLLLLIASAAHNASAAQRMADQFDKLPNLTANDWRALLRQFEPLCLRLNSISHWRYVPGQFRELRRYDLPNSARLQMLLSWFRRSGDRVFLEVAETIAEAPNGGFTSWDDGRRLPDILIELSRGPAAEKVLTSPLVVSVENAIRALLTSSLDPDDLQRIVEAIDAARPHLSNIFECDIAAAIPRMIEGVTSDLGHVDSESTLTDFLAIVESLAARVPTAPIDVIYAKEAIERRIEEVGEKTASDDAPMITGKAEELSETFSDENLKSLFNQLLNTEN